MKRLMIALALALAWTVSANAAIIIDVPPPAFDDPASPWHSLAGDPVITYSFKTSWNDIQWTDQQKAVAYDAFATLDEGLLDQTFEETGDFTLRWGGADFFKDWRDTGKYSADGWNLTGDLAVAYKHDNGPWDHDKYPNNEIYFNTAYQWSFGLLGVDKDKYDFWTVLLHETIHMLACDEHAEHEDEVMYETIGKGERKWLKDSDWAILSQAGYKTIPEPTSLIVWSLLGALALTVGSSRRRRAA